MKRILIIIIILLVATSVAYADDYLRIDTDSVCKGTSPLEINFYILRQCPNPMHILGASNGFVITDNGSGMTWSWVQFPVQDPASSINWELGGLLVTAKDVDGVSPDSILTGGATWGGFPVIAEEEIYFDIKLELADQEGEICIQRAQAFAMPIIRTAARSASSFMSHAAQTQLLT